jgi:hypothetical protein
VFGGIWSRHRGLKRWKKLVADSYIAALAEQGRRTPQWPTPPRARVLVHIERFTPGTLLDPDNFVGGLKPAIDGLKALHLIDEDNPAAIELRAQQTHTVGGQRRTVITLTLSNGKEQPWSQLS